MIFHTFPKAAQIPKTDLRGPEQDLKRLNPTLLSGYQPAALPQTLVHGVRTRSPRLSNQGKFRHPNTKRPTS